MKKLFLPLIALLFAINIYAAPPSTITYQGVLTDNSGAVLTGTYTIRFDVCTASSGVNSVWNETHSNVNVTNGLFQVELGSVAAFSTIPLDFSTPYWLEITIDPSGTPVVLSPRVAFNASGYSLSGHATSLKIATDAGLGKVLTSDANGDAAWSDFIGFEYVNPMSATGDILYSTGGNLDDFAALPIGTAGKVLTVNPSGTAPIWADASGGGGATVVNAEASISSITINNTSFTEVASITIPSTGKYLLTVYTNATPATIWGYAVKVTQSGTTRAGTSVYGSYGLDASISQVLNLTVTTALKIQAEISPNLGGDASATLTGKYSLVKLAD